MIRWLAIGLVLALAIALLIFFDIGIVLREALVWIFTLKATLKVYALRRLAAPFWRIVSKAIVIFIGARAYARLKKQAVASGRGVYEAWKKLNLYLRWGLASVALAVVGFFGFGLYLLPVWVPIAKPITTKFHMFWFDRVTQRYLRPLRRSYRAAVRRSLVLRIARWPHRTALYFLAIAIRRGGRRVRRQFA